MTQGKPWKNLLLFTLPLLIGNVFQQMYSTADAIILGRFVGDNALAAVGSSIPMFFLLMVVMMGISMGAGVMVSQYFGAKKRDDLSHTVGAALTLTTILGVVMMIIGPFITRPLLLLLNTPAEIIDDSVLYMTVLMVGILGMAYFNILSGILRGLGDAFSPLLYLAVTSILNVFLNLFLIPEAGSWTLFGIGMPGFGFGVWGAAIGTVFAQGLTSLLCLRRLRQMRDVFDMGIKYLRPKKEYANQLLKLGIPTAASQAIFAVAMMVVQPLANYFGPTFLAVNIIVMRIDGFVMMPNFSFGNAMTVYAGQNMGAGKKDRLGIGVKQCILMALGTAIVLVSALLTFGPHIAGWFTETEEVIIMATRMMRILAIGYIIFGVNMVLWGAIRGAGDAITPMWAAVINTLVVRVPTAYLFVYFLGRPEALFYSLLAGWTTNTLLGILAYRFGKWRNKGIVKQNEIEANDTDNMLNEREITMDVFEAITKRYSHKAKFLPDTVPLTDLERIAKAGLDAPSGANRQTVQLIILDRDIIAPLCEAAPAWGILETAHSAIAVLTDNTLTPHDAMNFEKEDYSAAVQNILLAATALGYASLWLDSPYFDEDKQKAALQVLGAPETLHLWAVIPIGKPDGEGSRRQKLPFAERVSYGRYGKKA